MGPGCDLGFLSLNPSPVQTIIGLHMSKLGPEAGWVGPIDLPLSGGGSKYKLVFLTVLAWWCVGEKTF